MASYLTSDAQRGVGETEENPATFVGMRLGILGKDATVRTIQDGEIALTLQHGSTLVTRMEPKTCPLTGTPKAITSYQGGDYRPFSHRAQPLLSAIHRVLACGGPKPCCGKVTSNSKAKSNGQDSEKRRLEAWAAWATKPWVSICAVALKHGFTAGQIRRLILSTTGGGPAEEGRRLLVRWLLTRTKEAQQLQARGEDISWEVELQQGPEDNSETDSQRDQQGSWHQGDKRSARHCVTGNEDSVIQKDVGSGGTTGYDCEREERKVDKMQPKNNENNRAGKDQSVVEMEERRQPTTKVAAIESHSNSERRLRQFGRVRIKAQAPTRTTTACKIHHHEAPQPKHTQKTPSKHSHTRGRDKEATRRFRKRHTGPLELLPPKVAPEEQSAHPA